MKKIVSIALFLLSFSTLALIEINGEYGLSTQKYGETRDNEIKELKNELQEMKDLIKQLIEK